MSDWNIFDNDAIAVLAIFAASLAVFLVLPRKAISPGDIRVRQMRLRGWLSRNYIWVLIGGGVTLLCLAAFYYIGKIPGLLGTTLTLLGEVLKETEPTDENTERIRNLAYAFAALAGALTLMATIPFQLIRVWLNERSARTAEQGHITERITKAVEALGAEKTVLEHRKNNNGTLLYEDGPDGKPDYKKPIITELTRPNLEVRIGAIYALERISQDSLRDHVQIMEILTAYIRQNAPADQAEDFRDPETGEMMPNSELLPDDADEAARKEHRARLLARLHKAWKWARTLDPRLDIQAAIRVVARRDPDRIALEKADRRYGDDGYRLDLRKTDLQAVDVSGLDLSRALLAGARLEGADLSGARLEGADLGEARLEGADIRGTRLEGANLHRARMEGADLREARLERADLREARIEDAHLGGARMEGANLREARLEEAYLREARMEGANLSLTRLEATNLEGARMEGANLHWARLERSDLNGARLEGANLNETRLEGANLSETRLEGVHLGAARFDKSTDLRAGSNHASALRAVDFTGVEVSEEFLISAFGDGSVTLPEGYVAGEGVLAHWRKEELDPINFHKAWRDWQIEIGYRPPSSGD